MTKGAVVSLRVNNLQVTTSRNGDCIIMERCECVVQCYIAYLFLSLLDNEVEGIENHIYPLVSLLPFEFCFSSYYHKNFSSSYYLKTHYNSQHLGLLLFSFTTECK